MTQLNRAMKHKIYQNDIYIHGAVLESIFAGSPLMRYPRNLRHLNIHMNSNMDELQLFFQKTINLIFLRLAVMSPEHIVFTNESMSIQDNIFPIQLHPKLSSLSIIDPPISQTALQFHGRLPNLTSLHIAACDLPYYCYPLPPLKSLIIVDCDRSIAWENEIQKLTTLEHIHYDLHEDLVDRSFDASLLLRGSANTIKTATIIGLENIDIDLPNLQTLDINRGIICTGLERCPKLEYYHTDFEVQNAELLYKFPKLIIVLDDGEMISAQELKSRLS